MMHSSPWQVWYGDLVKPANSPLVLATPSTMIISLSTTPLQSFFSFFLIERSMWVYIIWEDSNWGGAYLKERIRNDHIERKELSLGEGSSCKRGKDSSKVDSCATYKDTTSLHKLLAASISCELEWLCNKPTIIWPWFYLTSRQNHINS